VKSTESVLQQMGSQSSDTSDSSQLVPNSPTSTDTDNDSHMLIQVNQLPRQSEQNGSNLTQQSNQQWREATFVMGAIGVIFIVGVLLCRQELSNSPETVKLNNNNNKQ